MRYVSLITHQGDIKICTTNFQACLLTSHTIRIPIRSVAQYVCAMRRSLITFPFYLFFKSSKCPACRIYLQFSLQQCIKYCTYRSDTAIPAARSCLCMPILRKRMKQLEKMLFKSRRVNLKNQGKVKVTFALPVEIFSINFFLFSLRRLGGTFEHDVKPNLIFLELAR